MNYLGYCRSVDTSSFLAHPIPTVVTLPRSKSVSKGLHVSTVRTPPKEAKNGPSVSSSSHTSEQQRLPFVLETLPSRPASNQSATIPNTTLDKTLFPKWTPSSAIHSMTMESTNRHRVSICYSLESPL
ncbi:hypothetical protein B0O80DRAFT_463570 [Mortierella sp. GBAus27b]|nr:hypothetical protein B0O80DRAFT_463570 [Mortierella sp. GBAus27b]